MQQRWHLSVFALGTVLLVTSCGGRPIDAAGGEPAGSPASGGKIGGGSGGGSGGKGASGQGGAAGNPSPPAGGGKPDASTSFPAGIPLQANSRGFVDGPNAAGIIGGWYSFADGYGATGQLGAGPCQLAGHTDCSIFKTPMPGAPFAPDAQGRMCTAGHAAIVSPSATGTPDYGSIWGADIAFDLDNPGLSMKGSYDAIDRTPRITGFAFDIDVVPPNSLRVELATSAVPGVTDINSAFWGGATLIASPVVAGHNVFRWADVGGPFYLMNPPAFDPTKLLSLFFHVVTNTNAPVNFSFCVSNLTALTN